MMNLAEYRRSTTRLADFLPWAALVDEGIVLNKDGSFQRTARFRGPDLDSCRSSGARCGCRPPQQRSSSSRIRLGGVCGSAEIFIERLSAEQLSGCRIGPGRCRAPSPIRGRGRSLRVQPISSPSCICRRRRMRRVPSASSMRDGSAGRLPTPTKRCAALPTGPTACCSWSKGSCRSADGSMTARP